MVLTILDRGISLPTTSLCAHDGTFVTAAVKQVSGVRVEVEDAKPDLEFDANHAWNPRERVSHHQVGGMLLYKEK